VSDRKPRFLKEHRGNERTLMVGDLDFDTEPEGIGSAV
jgi:hypothetical protein